VNNLQEQGHEKTEAELRVMCPQAKDHQGLPATPEIKRRTQGMGVKFYSRAACLAWVRSWVQSLVLENKLTDRQPQKKTER
jgi:hypothetical protein